MRELALRYRTTITVDASPFQTNVFEVGGMGFLDVPVEEEEIQFIHKIDGWLPELLPRIVEELQKFESELSDRNFFLTELINPTVFICPYEGDPEGSWTFGVESASAEDFGYHLEFIGNEFQQIWAGD